MSENDVTAWLHAIMGDVDPDVISTLEDILRTAPHHGVSVETMKKIIEEGTGVCT